MWSRRKSAKALFGGLLLYLTAFLILQHGVIAAYEDWRSAKRHWLRPVYEPVFYPLRWLDANGWSFVPPRRRKVAGTVVDVSSTRLVLDSGRGYADYIGFVCEPAACAQLESVVKGAKIEAIFGATLISGRDRLANRLLQIRMGEPEDRDGDFQPPPCAGVAWLAALSMSPAKDQMPWPQVGVFTGYYSSGFEVSDFRPVGTKERWWLSWKREIGSQCDRSTPCYLVVRGKLSGQGLHGHLGDYKRELVVTEVIEQRSLNPSEKVEF
jgi:hypothetical protein